MASYLVSPMGQLLAHFSRSGEGEKTGLSVQIIATVARWFVMAVECQGPMSGANRLTLRRPWFNRQRSEENVRRTAGDHAAAYAARSLIHGLHGLARLHAQNVRHPPE